MSVYFRDDAVTVHHGDCLEILPNLPADSVDAIICDPPYSLSFMSKSWDSHDTPQEFQNWCTAWAAECLRVLKPGGYMLAFGGTRTWHRLTCAIEDAGFEIRDSIAWLYGSGFPKSLDVSKAIDKAAGAEREVTGPKVTPDGKSYLDRRPRNADKDGWDRPWKNDDAARVAQMMKTEPATDAARQWQGWGTALKPAFEPIVVARKPLASTVAANVLEHGTGALNIDACRVETTDKLGGGANTGLTSDTRHEGFARPWMDDDDAREAAAGRSRENTARAEALGRWPANVVLDDDQAAELDTQSGVLTSGANPTRRGAETARTTYGEFGGQAEAVAHRGADSGGASRFFPTFRYTAKANTAERPTADGIAHPTVKPLELMRWLVRLVTPPGGVVLDPFAGSGTTGEAAIHEHKTAILIERDPEYVRLIVARLSKPMAIGFDYG